MRFVHEYLNSTAFDLYELNLFHQVATHGSFTKAAVAAGLTQSAITRQVQALEESLSVRLFERTTRSVRLTPAGSFLLKESARLLGDAAQSVRRLREEFAGAKKEVRVGVSRSLSLAHLPGFFHANVRRAPNVAFRVSSQSSGALIDAVEASELDLGVLSPPPRLPNTLRVTHRFADAFIMIAPQSLAAEFASAATTKRSRDAWLMRQNWLLFDFSTNTGQRLHAWMERQGWRVQPGMQLDNFDLIINLVALGMGVAFVPIRGLAMYPRKRNLVRISLPMRFERELVVVVRRNRDQPEHVLEFVANVLF